MAFRAAVAAWFLAVAASIEIQLPRDLNGPVRSPAEVAAQLRIEKLFEGPEGGEAAPSLGEPLRAQVHVHNDPASSVTELNRLTLLGNVLREAEPTAENWFVFFYVEWDEACQELMAQYERVSAVAQAAENRGTFLSTPVRFAKVSCAKDKALCNELAVDDYPTITHFWRGRREKSWTFRKTSILAWVEKRLAWASKQVASERQGDALADLRLALNALMPAKLTCRWALNLLTVALFAAASLRLVLREVLPRPADKPKVAEAPAPVPAIMAPAELQAPEAVLPEAWARDRACLDL